MIGLVLGYPFDLVNVRLMSMCRLESNGVIKNKQLGRFFMKLTSMKDFMDFLKEWLVHLLSSYLSVVCRYFVLIC